MDEKIASQFYFDFRTSSQSAIHGATSCGQQRAACTTINRNRARGILEADQLSTSGQPLSVDVWEAAFARVARQWQLPIVSLEQFGITHDEDGFREASSDLSALTPGAEACPYLDAANGIVYKLFDLQANGSLGKKLSFELKEDGEYEIVPRPARLRDTLEKLILLNEVGAHPTEIVGLTDDAHYLMVKQPLANPYKDFEKDRAIACQLIRGVVPQATGLGLRGTVCIVWHDDQTWIIGDLHPRNIMRDGDGKPTIIDALVAPVPPFFFRGHRWLRDSSADARALRLGLPPPERKLFDDVNDEEL